MLRFFLPFAECGRVSGHSIARRASALAGFVFLSASIHAAGLGEIRVRSALGERFDAAVSVSAAESEVLSSACFQIVSPREEGDIRALRQARIDFRKTARGGEIHIQGGEYEQEPLLKVGVRLRCPEDDVRGVTREYGILLDPREYKGAPAAIVSPALAVTATKPQTASRPAARAVSVWRVRAGESAEGLARRYYPEDASRREQFITDLKSLNPDLPQDKLAPLPQDAFLALPAVEKVARQTRAAAASVPVARPARQEVPSSQKPVQPVKPSKPSSPPVKPAAQGEFRLQLSTVPLDAARVEMNLSEEDKLKLRERMLLIEADDQTAQLLQLKDRIARLEKQLAAVQVAASAPATVASSVPALRVATLTLEERINGWWWGFLVAVLLMLSGLLVWRWKLRREDKQEAFFAFDSGIDTELIQPAPSADYREETGVVGVESPVAAPSSQPNEEWGTNDMDVVSPGNVAEEAQLLLEHGLAGRAADLLLHEIALRPSALALWMKLFDVYHHEMDKRNFQVQAIAFQEHFASEALWRQVQGLGREIDPANALYVVHEAVSPEELAMHVPDSPPSGNDDFDILHMMERHVPPEDLEAVPKTPEIDLPLEFHLPEVEFPAQQGEWPDAPAHGPFVQEGEHLFGFDVPSLELPKLDSATAPLSPEEFVSADAVMQTIARMIFDGQREEAFRQLEELLYRGSFDQRLVAAKWLDRLMPMRGR